MSKPPHPSHHKNPSLDHTPTTPLTQLLHQFPECPKPHITLCLLILLDIYLLADGCSPVATWPLFDKECGAAKREFATLPLFSFSHTSPQNFPTFHILHFRNHPNETSFTIPTKAPKGREFRDSHLKGQRDVLACISINYLAKAIHACPLPPASLALPYRVLILLCSIRYHRTQAPRVSSTTRSNHHPHHPMTIQSIQSKRPKRRWFHHLFRSSKRRGRCKQSIPSIHSIPSLPYFHAIFPTQP
jgi:hypothetical protein